MESYPVILVLVGCIVILFETFRDGLKRKPRVGDNVLQNQPILYLPDISSMIVKTSIREVDLHKVKTGQSCTISVDAYPDKKMQGTVSFIGALASDKQGGNSGAKYFQMTISITSEDSDLRPGMTARVNILSARIDGALTLPLYAVFEEDGKLYFLETSARVGGANLSELVRAATGINLWREWAKIEILRGEGEYQYPEVQDYPAAIITSLAKQEWPDLSAYNDSEIFWRLDKPYHAGFVLRSKYYNVVGDLLDKYTKRFYKDFFTSAPMKERPSD